MAIFTSHGRLLGQITSPMTKNISLRRAQYAKSGDSAFVLSFARAVVRGKIGNCLEFIRGFAHNHPETDLHEESSHLSAFRAQVDLQADLPSLLGLEGASARAYFRAFARMVRRGFQFTGRRRRPAPDPVNALLSLGYTMVYKEIGSLLDGIGFDPYLGFYHQPRYGHATLASDLLEEFRVPLVDRLTLNLMNNRIFSEPDFYLHAASGSVYLKDEPRKRYFIEYESFVTRSMACPDDGAQSTFRKLFRRQAERLRQTVVTGEEHRPYKFSW